MSGTIGSGRPEKCAQPVGAAGKEYSSSGSEHSRATDGGARKLVILGLPYFTTDDTLHRFFGQYGEVEEASIMCDHTNGKSRGFGFVTFKHSADAARVAGSDYVVDGRRCEAKYPLPRGESASQRVTRIFVAKLPPSVAEDELRDYFQQFGAIQDVYMPKDASKQARRGIGFITFASPEAVERVMRQHHSLGGQELVVDKAAPKAKEAGQLSAGTLGGYAGAGVLYRGTHTAGHDSGVVPVTLERLGAAGQLSSLLASTYPGLVSKLHGQHLLGSSSTVSAYDTNLLGGVRENSSGDVSLGGLGLTEQDLNTGLQGQLHSFGGLSASNASVQLAIAQLARAQQAAQIGVPATLANAPRGPQAGPLSNQSGDVTGIWSTNRIFVGKLSKDIMETDIKEYCSRFGFVLDVYIPRDKNNKREHRGFGFVTFETEAAVERILAVEEHQIGGSLIAVDRALPRQDDKGYGEGADAVNAALGMAALGLGVSGGGIAGPSRHNNDRNRYYYQPY